MQSLSPKFKGRPSHRNGPDAAKHYKPNDPASRQFIQISKFLYTTTSVPATSLVVHHFLRGYLLPAVVSILKYAEMWGTSRKGHLLYKRQGKTPPSPTSHPPPPPPASVGVWVWCGVVCFGERTGKV